MRRSHKSVLFTLLAAGCCYSILLAAGAGCAKFTAVESDAGSTGVIATPPNPDEVFSFNIGTIPRLVQGTTTTIPITLTRSGPKKSDISVALKDAPSGVAANPLTIVRGTDSGELQITVSQDVPQGALDNTWIEGHALDATAYGRADLPLFVRGPAGSLDTTFATNGSLIDVFGGGGMGPDAVFVLSDDSVLLLGNFSGSGAAARISPDGVLDTTYGTNGTVLASHYCMALPDGRLICWSGRTAADGTNQDSVPLNPPVGTTVGTLESTTLAPDGHIFMVFDATTTAGAKVMGIEKLTNDGQIDTTFGNRGAQSTKFTGKDSSIPYGVAVRPDGRIVMIGTYSTNATDATPASSGYGLLQVLANGTLPDTSFGAGDATAPPGQITFPSPGTINPSTSSITPHGLQLLPDGRVISMLATYTGVSPSHYSYSITAFTTYGAIDTTFGNYGALAVGTAYPGLSLDDQSRLLVGHNSVDGLQSIVSRFTTVGVIDMSFGTNGNVTIPLPSGYLAFTEYTARTGVQKDGRIIVLFPAMSFAGNVISIVSRLWN